MTFTANSIIQHLDRCDYPLLNANYDIAAVRVIGFCSPEKWAIIFELLMSYPSSDGIGLMICAYGNGLKVKEGFETPILHNPFQWNKDSEEDDEEREETDYDVIPETLTVDVRGNKYKFNREDIPRLNRAPEFDFDLLVHLVDIYDEELLSTNDELYLYVARDLKKVVQFDNWYHEDDLGVFEGDKYHIPNYTMGVEIVAQILENGNTSLCSSPSAQELGFDWKVFK